MNCNEIANKFNSIFKNSEYIRVSAKHPLELYLGLNEKGLKTLRYNGIFEPIKVVGTNILEIKQVKTSEHYSILFSFNSNDEEVIFYKFCEDLINMTEGYNGDKGYNEIINRYNQWKKMFYGRSSLLNENEIMGLIGELLFLKDNVIIIHGAHNGVNGWSGPEPTHKDFSFDNEWYEVKTINSMKPTVRISSLEQLDSNFDGYLVVYTMEKMSPNFNGLSLNKIVSEICGLFEYNDDKDIFKSKLEQVGYDYNEEYDNYVYNLINVTKYLVNKEFPKLRHDDVPKGVLKVNYEIQLSIIERFRVN